MSYHFDKNANQWDQLFLFLMTLATKPEDDTPTYISTIFYLHQGPQIQILIAPIDLQF